MANETIDFNASARADSSPAAEEEEASDKQYNDELGDLNVRKDSKWDNCVEGMEDNVFKSISASHKCRGEFKDTQGVENELEEAEEKENKILKVIGDRADEIDREFALLPIGLFMRTSEKKEDAAEYGAMILGLKKLKESVFEASDEEIVRLEWLVESNTLCVHDAELMKRGIQKKFGVPPEELNEVDFRMINLQKGFAELKDLVRELKDVNKKLQSYGVGTEAQKADGGSEKGKPGQLKLTPVMWASAGIAAMVTAALVFGRAQRMWRGQPAVGNGW